jgi:glycosyltransferase involved in cell wall biosynthesis
VKKSIRIAFLGLRAIGQLPAAAEPATPPTADLLSLNVSGVERAVEELATRLASRGHDVTVFCRRRYNQRRIESFQGVRLIDLPALYTKHFEAISHTVLGSFRVLGGYDIVHYHATGPSLASFLPRLTGRGVVATVHGLDWQREKWRGAAKLILRAGAWTAVHFPHRTIVVSQSLQRRYAEEYHRPTVFIPNGVAPGVTRPADRIRRFGVQGHDYVLFLGRIVPEKGCHFLIEAFCRLKTESKLVIAGASSYTDEYYARLQAAAAGNPRVVFTGPLYGAEKDEAFSNARCVVLPSTLEGMPIVLLEALSYGCPVLCSDIPENAEVLRAGTGRSSSYGFLFKSASVEDLRARLAELLDSDEGPEKGLAGKAYVEKTFSWDQITAQTEEVYRAVAGR